MEIHEPDWKAYKKVYDVARERLAARMLGEIAILATSSESARDRFWNIEEHVYACKKQFERTFGRYSRSSAYGQLLFMRARDLLTEEEFGTFSEETRSLIDGWIKDATA